MEMTNWRAVCEETRKHGSGEGRGKSTVRQLACCLSYSMATQLERERMDHEKHLKTLALDGLLHLHAARPIAYDEGSVIDG